MTETPCFIIRHEHWNRARVFMGPDAEAQAEKFVMESTAADRVEFNKVFEADGATLYSDEEWLDYALTNIFELFEEAVFYTDGS